MLGLHPSKLRNVSGYTSILPRRDAYANAARMCVCVCVCVCVPRACDSLGSIGEFPISSISRFPTAGRSPAGFSIARIKHPVRRVSSPPRLPPRPGRLSSRGVISVESLAPAAHSPSGVAFVEMQIAIPGKINEARRRCRFPPLRGGGRVRMRGAGHTMRPLKYLPAADSSLRTTVLFLFDWHLLRLMSRHRSPSPPLPPAPFHPSAPGSARRGAVIQISRVHLTSRSANRAGTVLCRYLRRYLGKSRNNRQ